jgi:hypothetical protein
MTGNRARKRAMQAKLSSCFVGSIAFCPGGWIELWVPGSGLLRLRKRDVPYFRAVLAAFDPPRSTQPGGW